MKFILKYSGLALILLGVLLLVTLHLLHFTFVNVVLLTPFFIILAGVVLQVWMMKRESRY
jgi:hypothetical protein